MSMFAVANHAIWHDIGPELTPKDFQNPEKMDVDFLRLASRIRRQSGVPFRIVSDARTPDTNPGAEKSAHLELPCKALDLRVLTNAERMQLVKTALACGVRRIGVYPPTEDQKTTFGKASGSVHLDASTENPQDVLWMGW